MLKNYLVLILIMGFTPLAVNSTSLGENDKSVLEQEAQKRIKEFSSSLKSVSYTHLTLPTTPYV